MTFSRNITLLGIVAAILLSFAPLLIGRFYLIGDIRDVYIPLELFFQQEIRDGNIPSWYPDVAWGFPVIAAAQIGFFYPPLFISRLLLPIWVYLPVLVIAHALCGAIGMYLFLKSYDFSKSAIYVGTISFVLSQFIWEHTSHLNILLILPWFPWQMLFARSISRLEKLELHHAVVAALLLGTPFLIGQLQMPTLMAAISAIYFVYERYIHGKRITSSTAMVLGAAIISFLLASVQIFPTLELFQYSSRNNPSDFDIVRANQHSYPIYHLPTLLFPRFYGVDDTYWGRRLEVEYGFYIGVIPLVMAMWVYRRAFKPYRFIALLGLVSFLLALGSMSPFRLIGIEPTLWIFSAPARWLFFTTFALAFVAAFGFDEVQKRIRQFKKFVLMFALLVVMGVAIANVAIEYITHVPISTILSTISSLAPTVPLTSSSQYYDEKVSVLLASAKDWSVSLVSPYTAITLVLLCSLPFILGRKRTKPLLLLLTTIELIIMSVTTVPTHPWKETFTPPATISELPDHVTSKQSRLYVIREGGDEGALFTDPRTRASLPIRRQQFKLMVPMIHAQFGIPGVEWPASLDFAAHEIELEKLRGESGYLIQDIKQARRLNIGAVTSPNEDGVSVNIQTFDPSPRAELLSSTGEHLSDIQYTEIDGSHIEFETNTSEESTLVIRNSWFPGWRAYVDGKEVPVNQYPPFFQGIDLLAGASTVTLTYVPIMLYAGGVLSLLTALFCVIVIARKYISH